MYEKIAALLGTDIKPIYGRKEKATCGILTPTYYRGPRNLGYEPHVDFEKGQTQMI